MDFVELIYRITQKFPSEELYGMTSQMRRSAVSIPSNIAEGHSRHTRADFRKFISIAYGSGAELETQIEIAKRLGYISFDLHKDVRKDVREIMVMLNSLRKKLAP